MCTSNCIQIKPKKEKKPKGKHTCRKCGGNHKDYNSLKCPHKFMTWKQYWRPANQNGGNNPRPTFCQECMQEGVMRHNIEEVIASHTGVKHKQYEWRRMLQQCPPTWTCPKHRDHERLALEVQMASLFDPPSSEEEEDMNSAEASAPAPAIIEGGASKEEAVPPVLKRMLKEFVAEYGLENIISAIIS